MIPQHCRLVAAWAVIVAVRGGGVDDGAIAVVCCISDGKAEFSCAADGGGDDVAGCDLGGSVHSQVLLCACGFLFALQPIAQAGPLYFYFLGGCRIIPNTQGVWGTRSSGGSHEARVPGVPS